MEKYHQTLKVRIDENADAKKIPEPEADQLREELQDLLKTTISALNNIGDQKTKSLTKDTEELKSIANDISGKVNDLLGINKKPTVPVTFRYSEMLGANTVGDKTVSWLEPEVVEKRTDYHNLPLAKIDWHSDMVNDIRRLTLTNKGGEVSPYPESIGNFNRQFVTKSHTLKDKPISKLFVHWQRLYMRGFKIIYNDGEEECVATCDGEASEYTLKEGE